MAVEIGLHCTPEASGLLDEVKDQRNRVFWTIYAIEISLAYNLGRPSSIGDDHIASTLPKPTNENLSSLHHVRHRQIQSRIVAQVYGITNSTRKMSVEKKQMLILDLQKDLDEWQVNIPVDSQCEAVYPSRFVNIILLNLFMCANSTKATGIAFIMAQLLSCTGQVRSSHAPLLGLWSDVLRPLGAISTTFLQFFASTKYHCLGC